MMLLTGNIWQGPTRVAGGTMRPVMPSAPEPLGSRSVRRAYDTVAGDYAARLPDTRAEAPLDLAMVDAFAEAVTSGGDARVLDAGCGTLVG